MKLIENLFALAFAIGSAKAAFEKPEGVCNISYPKYTGGWFELASSDFVSKTLERGCDCSTAYYTLNTTNSENIDVSNTCLRYGQFWRVSGYSLPVEGETEGSRHVVLNSGFPDTNLNVSNYNIIKIWSDEYDDYTHALVGGDTENLWWLIGRSPNKNETILQNSFHVLLSHGYNITEYHEQNQYCKFIGGHEGVTLEPWNT